MNKIIAERLIRLRKEKGYSQDDLARMLGISRQAISKWERNESCPEDDNLICLSKLFKVSIDDLMLEQETSAESGIEETNYADNQDTPELINKNKTLKLPILLSVISMLLIIAVYLVLGFIKNLWQPYWLLLTLIPVLSSLFFAIHYKKAIIFAWPILIIAIYVFLGLQLSIWHPTWLILLTIPLYYLLFGFICKRGIPK